MLSNETVSVGWIVGRLAIETIELQLYLRHALFEFEALHNKGYLDFSF